MFNIRCQVTSSWAFILSTPGHARSLVALQQVLSSLRQDLTYNTLLLLKAVQLRCPPITLVLNHTTTALFRTFYFLSGIVAILSYSIPVLVFFWNTLSTIWIHQELKLYWQNNNNKKNNTNSYWLQNVSWFI